MKDNTKQLKTFLNCLFPEGFAGYIEQRPIVDGQGVLKNCSFAWPSSAQLLRHFEAMRASYLKSRANWYFGVLPRDEGGKRRIKRGLGAQKQHILDGYAVWADIDDKDTGGRAQTLALVEALSPQPSAIVQSGGGLHIYYFLDGPTNTDTIEGLNKNLIALCGADQGAWDKTRILRMPLSWHVKGAPVEVIFLKCEAHKFSAESLIEAWGAPAPQLQLLPITPLTREAREDLSPTIGQLLKKSAKLSALYEGREKGGGGTSPSDYDWAFCREALYLGASEIEVADALLSRLALTGRAHKGQRYVSLTTTKAVAAHRARGASRASPSPSRAKVHDGGAHGAHGSKGASQVATVATLITTPELDMYPEDYSNKGLRGKPLKSLKNCASILSYYQATNSPSIRYNEFDYREEYDGEAMADHFLTSLRLRIVEEWGVEFASDLTKDCLSMVARQDAYHPLKEVLMGYHERVDPVTGVTGWDGVDRICGEPGGVGLLERYCEAAIGAWPVEGDDEYHDKLRICEENRELIREIGLRWLLSCVARIFQPGCKVDTCLILCGGQGAGKGEFFKILSIDHDRWHSDSPLDVRGGRDTYTKLRGKWIWEFAELANLKHREANSTKQFITSQSYHYRPAYGKYDITQKAGTIFVGTSNEREILRDPTGSRRFWPVSVGVVDEARLKADLEQIWAQAVDIYLQRHKKEGRALWALPRHLWERLADRNESYRAVDSWSEAIEDWMNFNRKDGGSYRAVEIMSDALGIPTGAQNKAQLMRLSGLLSGMGWTKTRVRRVVGDKTRRVWAWAPPK